jgi:tRNA-intron endonuclease
VHSLHESVHVSLKSLSRTKAYFDPLDALPMPHEAVEGVLEGDRVEVKNGEELAERGFGVQAGESLWLSLVEAAYLVDKGELRVVEDGEKREIGFEDLVRRASSVDSSFWQKLVVYTDLRDRGLRAQPLEGTSLILAERKVKEGERRYMVLCLEEGVRIGFRELEGYIRRALESRRELVLAIVDKDGNISYYKVEKSLG